VIRDHRRIDPVTGQVRRGKHAASRPAGTSSAGRPGSGPGPAPAADEPGEPAPDDTSATAGVGPVGEANQGGASAGSSGGSDDLADMPEILLAEALSEATTAPAGDAQLKAQLAERTSDLQRLQAEYANYRKRVDRDRAAVKEQAVAATLTGLLPVLDAIGQARELGELAGGFKSVADSLQAALGRLGLVVYGEKGEPFDPKIHEALMHSYSPDVTEETCVEILQPGYKVGDRILRPARVAVAEPATGPDGAPADGGGGAEAQWPGSGEDEDGD
jgi:molecular chaperone GrpE